MVAGELDDAALILALPDASFSDCLALAAEAGQRKLTAAVPALEALCGRFKGFGLHRAVPEQVVALQALAAIGGRAAAAAVTRLLIAGAVQGPGLKEVTAAAAILYLVSPAGSYVTGKIMEVDGGLQSPNLEFPLPDL